MRIPPATRRLQPATTCVQVRADALVHALLVDCQVDISGMSSADVKQAGFVEVEAIWLHQASTSGARAVAAGEEDGGEGAARAAQERRRLCFQSGPALPDVSGSGSGSGSRGSCRR